MTCSCACCLEIRAAVWLPCFADECHMCLVWSYIVQYTVYIVCCALFNIIHVSYIVLHVSHTVTILCSVQLCLHIHQPLCHMIIVYIPTACASINTHWYCYVHRYSCMLVYDSAYVPTLDIVRNSWHDMAIHLMSHVTCHVSQTMHHMQ